MDAHYLLQRFSSGKESSLGLLHRVDGSSLQFRCFSLEDQYNSPKVAGETRIPVGCYKIELRTEGGMHPKYSARFGFHMGMLWLRDVPGFEYVYIHVGNDDDDTDACILVGDSCQSNVLEDGKVLSSVAAYSRLYQEILGLMDKGDVWLTTSDMDG